LGAVYRSIFSDNPSNSLRVIGDNIVADGTEHDTRPDGTTVDTTYHLSLQAAR
jgi:hypothetical protein